MTPELMELRRIANNLDDECSTGIGEETKRIHGLLDSLEIFIMAKDAKIVELESRLKCPTGAERKS